MQRNRMTQQLSRFSSLRPAASLAPAPAASGQPAAGSLVMVPLMGTSPGWQAELYRRAYEKAVADLAPPRYLSRFFSVWN